MDKKLGRPSQYKSEYDKKAYNLCRKHGFIDRDLAEVFDVSEVTINAWKNEYPSFLKSIKDGKAARDTMVERSLHDRAMGYTHKEEKIFNNQGEIVRAETVKHYPPDPTSMIFWLKNRQPAKWRDKVEIESHEDLHVTWGSPEPVPDDPPDEAA